MLNFILKHKSEKYLGNYALVSKHVPLIEYVCSVLDIDTEKSCSIFFFCLQVSIEFDTSLLFAFFTVKSAYLAIFRGTQYIYIYIYIYIYLIPNILN